MGCSSSVVEVDARAPERPGNHAGEFKEGQHWKCLPDDEQEPSFAKSGPGSLAECPQRKIIEIFEKAVSKYGDKPFLRAERPVPPFDAKTKRWAPAEPFNTWKTWTYKGVYDIATNTGKAYMALGGKQHESVVVFGFNAPEWHMACYGALFCGQKSAGIYPTDGPEQVAYKSAHSGASIAVCETIKGANIFVNQLDNIPKLKAIVVWGEKVPDDMKKQTRPADGSEVLVMTWDELQEYGPKTSDSDWQERLGNIRAGHAAALIYTSGTTGNPKAVMITHDNISFEAGSVMKEVSYMIPDHPHPERLLSYLPLTHVAGMLVDIITPIVCTADTHAWLEVGYARPYDLKVGSLRDRLVCLKPTLFLGVPRVWEKVSEGIKAKAKTSGPLYHISKWAKATNLEHNKNCSLGGSGAKPSGWGTANKIMRKVQGLIGLDEMKFGLTAAAPIKVETLEYFGSLGISINEAYGMSECCGTTTWSTNRCHVWGSCGYALAGTEVACFKVDEKDFNIKEHCPLAKDINNVTEEEQGELCYRGRHVMMGYMANPDLGEDHVKEIQKKNAETIDREGWLHSGDKGTIGENGMIKITGRYKELIIGAGGENISPVPIEDMALKLGTALANVMMVGDKRKYNIALITLKVDGATGELPGTMNLTGDALLVNPEVTTVQQAMKDEKWKEYIVDVIVRTNKTVPNNPSKIQRFTILPYDFSVMTEDLTATLKLKRSVVEKKHTPQIDRVYEPKDPKTTYVEYPEDMWPPAWVPSTDAE